MLHPALLSWENNESNEGGDSLVQKGRYPRKRLALTPNLTEILRPVH